MNTDIIHETCSCGATFNGHRLDVAKFRTSHRHEFPPVASIAPTEPDFPGDGHGDSISVPQRTGFVASRHGRIEDVI